MWQKKCFYDCMKIMKAHAFILFIFSSAQTATQPLDPNTILKYQQTLTIPYVMPRAGFKITDEGKCADYYKIAVRQFKQQILPVGMPSTTVWGYGSITDSQTFNYPAFTIEAQVNKPVIVKWINQLIDENGDYLPHLFAVDQTVLWANPPGGFAGRDSRGVNPNPYTGPVPIVTHVHGAHANQDSEGYPESWYLPDADNIPEGYATTGTYYDIFKKMSKLGKHWICGKAVFEYPNDQRSATMWYHDHALGITRLNVYAGLSGFYILRGGDDDKIKTISGGPAKLPYPAPGRTVYPGQKFYEIPIAIQDRSFNTDGSLFYPNSRAFFDGFSGPYIPNSDISPIWNPAFLGNTIVVNGKTWPFLEVEQRRYRLRFLNGCQTRVLILKMDNDMPFWQIGADGGFLPAPVQLTQLLMAPAERADLIIDFSSIPVGTNIILQNLGPAASPNTTDQIMQFRVIVSSNMDNSTPPDQLALPTRQPLGVPDKIRQVSLNEECSTVVFDPITGDPICPKDALLGTVHFYVDSTSGKFTPLGTPLRWKDPVTENPVINSTEIWEIYNFTPFAHPIHLYMVQFEVVNREIFDPLLGTPGTIIPPEAWETGTKDTVIAHPGQITRIKAKFDKIGLFAWHCHILEHEDNEMMRPYVVRKLVASRSETAY